MIENCVSKLRAVSLALDTYGSKTMQPCCTKLSHNFKGFFPPDQV